MSDKRLNDQIEYYRARAPEYDEWFFRQGRYDRGPEHRAEWFAEIATVKTALDASINHGRVLELACGTGLWTRHLAETNAHVVAVDASPEAIAINRERVRSDTVEYLVTDLFSWTPSPAVFDAVFFGFWLSHVPPDQFERFWGMVRTVLKPDGRVFFVDSLREDSSTARDHEPLDGSGVVRRKLNDGREFEIVKVFYEPLVLERWLSGHGWHADVHATGKFFLYGSARTATVSPAKTGR